jgi:DNA-binding IclR family transcriptional regulator
VIEEWLTGPRGRGSASPPSDLVQSVRRAVQLMEIIGSEPGLTVKQMARRLEMHPTTAYHLIRTLVYEGYLIRNELGIYTMGPAVSDRFRDLARALRGPDTVTMAIRRAVAESGYSHYLAKIIGGRVTVTTVVEGPYSPWLEDLVPGFDDGAHATALGKALLALLEPHRRERYLKESGMRSFTDATITDPTVLEADLSAGRKRGMQVETGQYRSGVACAAVPVVTDGRLEDLAVLGVSLPIRDFMHSAKQLRDRLQTTARMLASLLDGAEPVEAVADPPDPAEPAPLPLARAPRPPAAPALAYPEPVGLNPA